MMDVVEKAGAVVVVAAADDGFGLSHCLFRFRLFNQRHVQFQITRVVSCLVTRPF
jgi:hypothetical protein